MYTFKTADQALVEMSKEILQHGKWRETRGFNCLEFPEPVMIKIENPCGRSITIPERKWNKVLPWVESLWIASGTNHLDMVTKYVKNMANFSDDGLYMRAAYGPRIRSYDTSFFDYRKSYPHPSHRQSYAHTDQLRFVVETLKKDLNSRQALITIHDPNKDCFLGDRQLKVTKDQPCTRSLHFQINSGKLDLITYMRSNDLVWGASAVNWFNFTLMQEYVSMIMGVPVGSYYHIADNLHIYDHQLETVETLSKIEVENNIEKYYYNDQFTLDEFDDEILRLFNYEKEISESKEEIRFESKYKLFRDWSNVFLRHWVKGIKVEFNNPNIV